MTDTMPAALTQDELSDLRRRMCGQKRGYGAHQAQQVAARMRAEGEKRISAYPCPFHPVGDEHTGRTWHVGHAPSMYRVGLLSRYIRFGGPE